MGVDLFAQIKELQKVISAQSRCLGAKNDSWGISHHEKIGGGGRVYLRMPLFGVYYLEMSMEVTWRPMVVSI